MRSHGNDRTCLIIGAAPAAVAAVAGLFTLVLLCLAQMQKKRRRTEKELSIILGLGLPDGDDLTFDDLASFNSVGSLSDVGTI